MQRDFTEHCVMSVLDISASILGLRVTALKPVQARIELWSTVELDI